MLARNISGTLTISPRTRALDTQARNAYQPSLMSAFVLFNARHSLPRRLVGPVCLAAILSLAGCEDPSADLQLQVTHARTELEAAKAEIQDLRAEGSRTKEQPAEAARPAASDEGFREAAKNFAGQLEAELKGANVNSPSYSEVRTGATFHFMLRMQDGSSSGQKIEATAGPDGRWIFPSASDAVRRILAEATTVPANVAQQQPQAPPAQPSVQPVQPSQVRQPAANPGGPGLPVDETKTVNWGDKARQPATARNPAPQPAPAPAPPPPPALAKPTQPRTQSPSLPRADEERSVSFDRKK